MSKKTENSGVMTSQEFFRLANNFYGTRNLAVDPLRYALDIDLTNYVAANRDTLKDRKKVAFVWICLNPPYWQFAADMLQGAREFFLPGHDTDFFLWSDIPRDGEGIVGVINGFKALDPNYDEAQGIAQLTSLSRLIHEGMTVIPTEPVEWPMPTLMRYHLFLQQEEKLKDYDYIFYCDVDMKFVSVVGDEILGNGLTAALHPGYAIDKKFWPPYEPNRESACYIPRPGKIIDDGGKPRFMPMYFAGGFQGGRAKDFIQAMKDMKKLIDRDFTKNYIPIWNDESAWNKYLFEHEPEIVLTPSYIFPDSLLEEYYYPLWGVRYPPKLMTLTKKFSTSKEGGAAAAQMIEQMKGLRK